jgi:UDP-N-acetylglucosamine acyltransferase
VISDKAVIDKSAKIGEGVKIGPGVVIGPNVEIGDFTEVSSYVVIDKDTTIGQHNKIYPYVSIGADPQDESYKGEPTSLVIGDHNVIREFATVHRASNTGDGVTQVGNHNHFLAYSHIAHDCKIGNHILFVNNATVAGHVTIEDRATLSAFTAVHQHCRVGSLSFVGRAATVARDIPPYMMVTGNPGYPTSLNLVGLKRNGFSSETIRALKRAFYVLYRRDLQMDEVWEQMHQLAQETPEVQGMIEFMQQSKRGIARRLLSGGATET